MLGAGVRTNLAEAGAEFEIIGTCTTHAELVERAKQEKPPLILYCLPPNGGLNGVEELQSAAPGSALVLVVRDLAAELGHQALEMGVRGVVSTSARPETLCECVRLSSTGHTWVDGALSAELLGAHSISLSPRQGELLELLLRGLKNKEIAAEMGLSVATVKAYLATLFEKVGAKDRFELALFGLKHLSPSERGDDHSTQMHPQLHSLLAQGASSEKRPANQRRTGR